MSQLFGMNFFNLNNTQAANKTNETTKIETKKNTIGNPKLSENAASYYEELKAKYGDAEFVLVSDDRIEGAKEMASNMNSDKSMIVLISESELEQMATDEATRNKNEKLIADAQAQMPDIMEKLKESGTEVKSFGMELNGDGTVSYFAVLDKSMAAQKERIEENRAEKKEAAAAEKKAAEKKVSHKEELTTVTASSVEELIKKIQDTLYEAKSDNVLTEQEKMVGQHFDLKF